MKKLCFLLTIFILLFTSCEKVPVETKKELLPGFVANDNLELNDILTVSYNIEELDSFFGKVSANERFLDTVTVDSKNISAVNDQFPIECLRLEKYTVYKVNQGGYYYVFWNDVIDPTSSSLNSVDLVVYFTAYFPSLQEKSDFDVLKPGASTAEDVAIIDSNLELCFLQSNGIYSYSLLNDGSIMEIKYSYNQNYGGREDLIVDCMNVIERKQSPSVFSTILAKDLP